LYIWVGGYVGALNLPNLRRRHWSNVPNGALNTDRNKAAKLCNLQHGSNQHQTKLIDGDGEDVPNGTTTSNQSAAKLCNLPAHRPSGEVLESVPNGTGNTDRAKLIEGEREDLSFDRSTDRNKAAELLSSTTRQIHPWIM
jgi:hypothetical protein